MRPPASGKCFLLGKAACASRAPAGAPYPFFQFYPGTARADRSVAVLAALTSIGPLVPGYSPWPLRGRYHLVLAPQAMWLGKIAGVSTFWSQAFQ